MNIDDYLKWLQCFFYVGSIVTAFITFVYIRKQLIHSKQIAKVQFLFELQQEWQKTHAALAKEFLGTGIFTHQDEKFEKDRVLKHFDVVNYILFFELIAVAEENNSIDLYQVDDLFGHRFSRMYSNAWVQKNIFDNEEYQDGFSMLNNFFRKWMMYRKTLNRSSETGCF